jgi:hypothetical protein
VSIDGVRQVDSSCAVGETVVTTMPTDCGCKARTMSSGFMSPLCVHMPGRQPGGKHARNGARSTCFSPSVVTDTTEICEAGQPAT